MELLQATTSPNYTSPVKPYNAIIGTQYITNGKDDIQDNKRVIAINFPPEMMAIIKCESGFAQFSNGRPKISPTDDVGIMQINIKAHATEAKKLGLDIFNSRDDNIAFGKILYDREGKYPWVCHRLV